MNHSGVRSHELDVGTLPGVFVVTRLVTLCSYAYDLLLQFIVVACIVTWPTSCRIMSCNIIPYHMINILSCHIISFHIISCHVLSYHILSCHVISYYMISYHILPRRVASRRVLSRRVVVGQSVRPRGRLNNINGYY